MCILPEMRDTSKKIFTIEVYRDASGTLVSEGNLEDESFFQDVDFLAKYRADLLWVIIDAYLHIVDKTIAGMKSCVDRKRFMKGFVKNIDFAKMYASSSFMEE